ncbi:hypothetical protein MNBD_GAMMA01-1840 [hydrothermal vent metagenome]|uniref:Uncharacterized protein n=1 Tax=hydrothermal vent metagenome TaxID=652676 RepID=A0A3B0WCC7_9ZZZZ
MLCCITVNAGVVCVPDNTTAFSEYENMIFRITNDISGVNSLHSQCTDLTNEVLIGQLNNCPPLPNNPINGLGLNPVDKLLYGLSPTDALGIGSHLEVTLPFPSPGQPGDIMKADVVDIYKIGNDGGFQNIGSIQPPTETAGLPSGTNQVVPIVHSAASFNQAGDLFILAYRTNYTASANILAGTAEVLYQEPQIVIGQISNADLTNANGGNIPTNWADIDDSSDAVCAAVVNKFRDDTNTFSVCVVNQFLATANEDFAVQTCLGTVPIIDKGIHDFAVSPVNGHYYGYDSMTYDDRDVLIEVNPNTNTASCTEIADAGNTTGVLTSLMFSSQNKLVAIFSNQTTGNWIDISNGDLNPLPATIATAPFGDGSSLPFASLRTSAKGSIADLIFQNGFENELIFANGFEGEPPLPLCQSF